MAWTNNEEELLILSDDTDIWSDFVLDEQIIDENNSTDTMISFDDISLDENTLNISEVSENTLTTTEDSENSFWDFSLWNDNESLISWESMSIDNDKTVLEEGFTSENLSFWSELDNDTTSVIEEDSNSWWTNVWTMTDILDEAIAKFVKREGLIWKDIDSRESNIKSLKNEIAELERKVNKENEEVSTLNTEKQAILKNRKALEKMKNDMNNSVTTK